MAACSHALGAILADGTLEPAFVALALTLPGEADIAREIGRDVDPDAIFAARSGLRAAVGEHLAGSLFDHYRRLSESRPYSPDAASAGRRALRNICLDLLVATRRPDAISLAARQYQAADNMTDRMAALSTLSLCDVPERAAALDDFYARYADDPLIVDKWFTLQATIPEPATLDRVKALTGHRAFSFANPNRVRALIHAFALANQREFNRADGAGYDFVVGYGVGARSQEPATRGAAVGRHEELARAGAGTARDGGEGLAAGRRRAVALARRGRHRPARPCRPADPQFPSRLAGVNELGRLRAGRAPPPAPRLTGTGTRPPSRGAKKPRPIKAEAAINKT